MQLQNLRQKAFDYYLMLEALMLQIEMYWYFNQDLHQSSEFEVLHDYQETD